MSTNVGARVGPESDDDDDGAGDAGATGASAGTALYGTETGVLSSAARRGCARLAGRRDRSEADGRDGEREVGAAASARTRHQEFSGYGASVGA